MNSNELNKVVNVNLSAGIIGLFADSPQRKLDRAVKKYNKLGYRVVQVIPAHSGNILLWILRIILLIITIFFYTTANGYYLILEKAGSVDASSLKAEGTLSNSTEEKPNIDDLFN